MPNLRIISDNALDRATSFTAANTSASYPASNMLNEDKSSTWRTTGGTLTTSLSATWTSPEPIGAVVFPICNFTSKAIGRVRATKETSTTNYVPNSNIINNWIDNGSGLWGANYSTAPDSTITATRATTQSNGGAGDRYQTLGGMPAGIYTYSLYAKTVSTNKVSLYVDFAAGGAAQATFNLDTGVVATTINSITLSARATWLGYNGWWRVEMTLAAPAGTLYTHCQVIGSANTSIDVWGAQFEFGTKASSFFPTNYAAAARPIGFIDTWQSYDYDSGIVFISPAPSIKLRGFTATQALGAYAYGGGSCARIWIPEIAATGIRVDIDDTVPPGNPQGYLEIARAIMAPYWSPTYNASAASWTPVDSTTLDRTDAGGQIADAGYIYKRVSIDLSMMPATDRATCARLLRSSRAYPIFLSLFPEDADLELERDNSVYGRRTSDSEISIENSIYYGLKIPVEEI